MDHLLVPQDSVLPQQQVKFVADSYDGGPFLTYPTRNGLIPHHTSSDDASFLIEHDGRYPLDNALLERLLQTWVFFGLLHAFLNPQGLFDERAYIEGQFIHTRTLLSTLEHWCSDVYLLSRDQRLERKRCLLQYLQAAQTAVQVLGNVASLYRKHDQFDKGIKCSLAAILDTLAGAIDHAVPDNVGTFTPMGFQYMDELQNREQFLQLGWCPSDIALQSKLLQNMPSLYYVQRLRPANLGLGHHDCPESMCDHLTVKLDTYTTCHVHEGCSCVLVGPDEHQVAQILDAGTFPIMKVTGALTDSDYSSIGLQVLPRGAHDRYVSFSHVWADGLGNPRSSSLPQCQLWRLAKLAGDLTRLYERDAHATLPIWCDSLCVPAISEAGNSEQERLKRLGIQRLRDVYAQATYVLVLDRSLEAYSLANIDMIEACFRLIMSRWYRRLWCMCTCNERSHD